MKLPRNKKEHTLFMAIISIISVNIIAPVITMMEMGFCLDVYKDALHTVPLIWPIVILLVLLTEKPAGKLTFKIVREEDSFNAVILTNILCCVLMMSVVLTIVGALDCYETDFHSSFLRIYLQLAQKSCCFLCG